MDVLDQQALRVLNEHPNRVLALTFNPRNAKWIVLELRRDTDNTFIARPFSAGTTPKLALKDALTLLVNSIDAGDESSY
jgi:hypothetical protein